MKKDNKVIPWSDEEVILLKLNYACKGAKTWREISQNMQEYTGVIRTTTSLITRIQKLRDDNVPLTIADMTKLYHSIVFDTEGTYTKKFINFITEHFSKQFSGDTSENIEKITSIQPESQIEKNRVDMLDGFDYEIDAYEEDKYVDEDEYDTKWNLGLVLDCLMCATVAIAIIGVLIIYAK